MSACFDSSSFSVSPEALWAQMGHAQSVQLLDVRREAVYLADTHSLASAQRCAPEHIAQWAAARTPQPTVVACVYGHNVGCDAAAALRALGWTAWFLAGGMLGGQDGEDAADDITHWRAHALPRMKRRPDLGVKGVAPSRWVTRAQPKIDRIACVWLLRRFVDPLAVVDYVPKEQVLTFAQAHKATAFDIEGAPISHAWEKCSFDALIEAFDLHIPALDALATIVRGADTDRLQLSPECAGLLSASLGLSHLHANDDQAMQKAALPMYDGLFARIAHASSERHTWKTHIAQ